MVAQNLDLQFEHLTEKGFPQEGVSSIIQDKYGFIWIVVGGKLLKFDGYEFANYEYDPSDSLSLGSEELSISSGVSSIYEDHFGDIWVVMMDGIVYRFNQKTEQFRKLLPTTDDSISLKDLSIHSFYEDQTNSIWLGNPNGLFKLDRKEERVKLYEFDTNDTLNLSNNYVGEIIEDDSAKLWIGTNDGLYKLDPISGKFQRFIHHQEKEQSLSHNIILSLLCDEYGTLWVLTMKGLDTLNRKTQQFHRFDLNPIRNLGYNLPTALYEDAENRVWIGTNGKGLYYFERDSGTFINFSPNPNDSKSLSHFAVGAMINDFSGNLWVGTLTGLDRAYINKQPFRKYLHDPSDKNNFIDPTVNFIIEGKNHEDWLVQSTEIVHFNSKSGLAKPFEKNIDEFYQFPVSVFRFKEDTATVWIGDYTRLIRFNPLTTQMDTFPIGLELFSNKKRPGGHVNSIIRGKSGLLWLGLAGAGLYSFNPKTAQYKLWKDDSLDFETTGLWIMDIVQDSLNNLWVSADEGLLFVNPDDAIFQLYKPYPKDTIDQFINGISDLIIFKDLIFCLGGKGNFSKFDSKSKTFHHYKHNPADSTSIGPGKIGWSLFQDKKNNIWIPTSKGINRFFPDQEIFQRYDEQNGLASNNVIDITEDNNGNIWVVTDMGLSKLNSKGAKFTNYDATDGIPKKIYSFKHQSKQTGNIYARLKNGFLIFHPDSIRINNYIPPIVISSLEVSDENGQTKKIKGIGAKEKLLLSYKEHILNFKFAALNYENTSKNQYAYKLEGFQNNWVQNGTNREATFTNLDPGEYTLRVKGSNNHGIWNEEGTSLKITITPPWWQTWWARTLYVLTGLVAVFGYVQWRTATLKKRQKLLEQTVTERTAEIVAQKEVILKEKDRSEQLLLNILPAEIAEELKENGASPAKDFDQVTVLFTDFKGFTIISEQLSARELVAELNICFKAFDEIITKYRIEKIKTIGDAYMAAGGLHLPRKTEAKDVVYAALEMQEFMQQRKEENDALENLSFEMRCGIHTGSVVAGIVGVKKFQYDIWGDTVNIASRMESSGAITKVNISQPTYELVKNNVDFRFTPRGKIKAKNKGELNMYFVDVST